MGVVPLGRHCGKSKSSLLVTRCRVPAIDYAHRLERRRSSQGARSAAARGPSGENSRPRRRGLGDGTSSNIISTRRLFGLLIPLSVCLLMAM